MLEGVSRLPLPVNYAKSLNALERRSQHDARRRYAHVWNNRHHLAMVLLYVVQDLSEFRQLLLKTAYWKIIYAPEFTIILLVLRLNCGRSLPTCVSRRVCLWPLPYSDPPSSTCLSPCPPYSCFHIHEYTARKAWKAWPQPSSYLRFLVKTL